MTLDMKIPAFFAIGIFIFAAYLLYGYLVPTEEDSVEAFVRKIARELPENRAEDYLDYVSLERYGFRLEFRRMKESFGREGRAAFIKSAEAYANMIQGSEIDVIRVEVELLDLIARVDMTAHWKAGGAKRAPVRQALIDADVTLIRGEAGYKVTGLKVMRSSRVFGGRF